jgi:hypothetical protein
VRPRPKTPTFVAVDSASAEMPRRSVLLVKVSVEGRTLEVRSQVPSDDPEFERKAREFAAGVEWNPATNDGKPVVAWTQWPFAPVHP